MQSKEKNPLSRITLRNEERRGRAGHENRKAMRRARVKRKKLAGSGQSRICVSIGDHRFEARGIGVPTHRSAVVSLTYHAIEKGRRGRGRQEIGPGRLRRPNGIQRVTPQVAGISALHSPGCSRSGGPRLFLPSPRRPPWGCYAPRSGLFLCWCMRVTAGSGSGASTMFQFLRLHSRSK